MSANRQLIVAAAYVNFAIFFLAPDYKVNAKYIPGCPSYVSVDGITWGPSDVYVNYGNITDTYIQGQISRALKIWSKITYCNTNFIVGPAPPGANTYTFQTGSVNDVALTTKSYILGNHVVSALTTFNPNFIGSGGRAYQQGASGYDTIYFKVALHEIGHTMGLQHPLSTGYDNGSNPRQTVMNLPVNTNDTGDNLPKTVTGCDVAAVNTQAAICPYPSSFPSSPGQVSETGGTCGLSMQNFERNPCPYGYTSDTTGYYCCRTGCPIQDCSEDQAECENNGGLWKGCCTGCFSPIVIDVAGNDFNLTDGNNGVMLDLLGDGTKDKVAWTAPNSDDAWLALDRNHNGMIDNALELFGNFTEQPDSITVKDRNGFLALAVFDQPQNGGNGDGKINRQDRVYNDLRLWQDINHNGISEPNELHTLPDLDVRALLLDFKETRHTDNFGNRFKYRARVRDTRDADVGKFAWDVFLVKPR